MHNLSRRRVLSLGAALGLVSATSTTHAWAWSPTGSVAGTGTGTDPEYVWDDEVDQLVASLIDNGHVPAVNTAMASWVNNNDLLPSGLPADLTAYLQKVNKLPPGRTPPSWLAPPTSTGARTRTCSCCTGSAAGS